MKYYYFGRDSRGFFADEEDGTRAYLDEPLWHAIIQAASRPAPQEGERLKLSITDRVHVDVYEHDRQVKSVSLSPDTTTFGAINGHH